MTLMFLGSSLPLRRYSLFLLHKLVMLFFLFLETYNRFKVISVSTTSCTTNNFYSGLKIYVAFHILLVFNSRYQ